MTRRLAIGLGALIAAGAVVGFAAGLGVLGQPSAAEVTPGVHTAAAASQGQAQAGSPAGATSSTSPTAAGTAPAGSGSSSPGVTPSASQPPYHGPMTRVVPVLMYHLIGDPPPGAPYPGLYVSAADFTAQMQALHDAGWHTITAGQLGAAMAANQPVPVRTFVVTFDDGYQDNYTTALPILQQFGFVATFSVVARGGPEMMSSVELASLVSAGMEIGNHTMDHRNVARLMGSVLREQIVGGALRIETRLASAGVTVPPRTFVYPAGHVGPAAVALLSQLGYTDAFTEVPGNAVIGTTPPLTIPRHRVGRGETLAAFLAAMPVEPPRP